MVVNTSEGSPDSSANYAINPSRCPVGGGIAADGIACIPRHSIHPRQATTTAPFKDSLSVWCIVGDMNRVRWMRCKGTGVGISRERGTARVTLKDGRPPRSRVWSSRGTGHTTSNRSCKPLAPVEPSPYSRTGSRRPTTKPPHIMKYKHTASWKSSLTVI